jgi:hypothetical protein
MLALVGRQKQQRIAGTAFLEAAGSLQCVELAKNARTSQLGKRRRFGTRRDVNRSCEASAGGANIIDAQRHE